MKIALINGPNLNFLGIREPEIYGHVTLKDIEQKVVKYGKENDLEIECFQSNSEGALIDFLQQCYYNKIEGIVFNPGAYTHYSYALSDAIKSIHIPTIEVHISNIYQREEFRRHSVTASSCIGIIGGLGIDGYILAIDALKRRSKKND